MIHNIKSAIPNLITSLNLLSGCLACIFAFRGTESIGVFTGYEWAYLFIAIAAVFDFCDGASARLLHAYSLLGKELDSLSDLVSFGLAPSMLVFNTMSDYSSAQWPAYIALIIPIFGALRLARFNVDNRQTTSFIGMPIPANAIFWIGICAWIHQFAYPGDILMSILVIGFSALMVSRLRMFSLKIKSFAFTENIRRYAVLVGAISFLAVEGLPGLAWSIILYVILSALSRKRDE